MEKVIEAVSEQEVEDLKKQYKNLTVLDKNTTLLPLSQIRNRDADV